MKDEGGRMRGEQERDTPDMNEAPTSAHQIRFSNHFPFSIAPFSFFSAHPSSFITSSFSLAKSPILF